jgi:outer membrane protein OmpA-like peptidoglycan-associated protein
MQKQVRFLASLLAVCLLAAVAAFGVTNGEKVKTKGVITNRTGDTLIVKTSDGPYTVVLNSDTKVVQPVGLGARHKDVSPDVMIPGLRLKFEGVGDDQNRVLAKRIEFDNDDLALAEVIQAGLNPTAQQQAANMQTYAANKAATDAAIAAANQEIQENKQRIAANQSNIRLVADKTKERFSELTEWVPKAEATVHFNTGESVISDEHKKEIAALAEDALKYKGYVIEVKGYADSVGRLAANQQLSKERAEAVVAYLLQDCHVPVKNIVAPGAMSETHPVASNETPSGRAENRRVEIRLLVNRGIAGTSGN